MPIASKKTEQNHSEVIQEIISAPPAWLLRWGIITIFSILVLIFSLSALIKYPDIVMTSLKITSADTYFYGEIAIPQYSFGKVRKGQDVLIKFKSYPYEEYGIIRGKINYISDVPNDSVFLGKVSFKNTLISPAGESVTLKNGMNADAEIITQDASLLRRITRTVTKGIK